MAVRTRAPKLRRQWIARPNALAALGNTLDFALVLLTAPAGYGKTALASQYAASQPSVCAWLTLTAEERDPTNMAGMMRESILGLHPELRTVAPAECAEPQPTAKTLISMLSADGIAPLTLVLDDLGSIDESPQAIELIGEARILRTEDLLVEAIRCGRLNVAQADECKLVLAANRYAMPFASFAERI